MRRMLAWLLFVGTVAWGVVIVGAPRIVTAADGVGRRLAETAYVVGSAICHQRPERSFHAGATQWPVCARCSGLYLAAPAGVIVMLLLRRRRGTPARPAPPHASAADPLRRWRTILILTALPTAISLLVEWLGGPSSSLSRFVAALPLGAAVAALVAALILGLDAHDRHTRSRAPRERVATPANQSL